MEEMKDEVKSNNVHIVSKQIFDLESFDDVWIGREFTYTPVTSVSEALARLDNDEKSLIEIVNAGLLDKASSEAKKSSDGWRTFATDAEGEVVDYEKLNGDFTGTIANSKDVDAVILTMAKTVFGYQKEMDKDPEKSKKLKQEAKLKAKDFVKSNEMIVKGLRDRAAKEAM